MLLVLRLSCFSPFETKAQDPGVWAPVAGSIKRCRSFVPVSRCWMDQRAIGTTRLSPRLLGVNKNGTSAEDYITRHPFNSDLVERNPLSERVKEGRSRVRVWTLEQACRETWERKCEVFCCFCHEGLRSWEEGRGKGGGSLIP